MLDFRRLVGGVDRVLDDTVGLLGGGNRPLVPSDCWDSLRGSALCKAFCSCSDMEGRLLDSAAPAESGWLGSWRSGRGAMGKEPVSSCILLADSRRTPSGCLVPDEFRGLCAELGVVVSLDGSTGGADSPVESPVESPVLRPWDDASDSDS